MARGELGIELRPWRARRGLGRRVAREQAHQRVVTGATGAPAWRGRRANSASSSPTSRRPSELHSTRGRAGRRSRMRVARARRRPSRGMCMSSDRDVERLARGRSSAAPRAGDSVSRVCMPHLPPAASARGGWWRCRRRRARACPRARAARRRSSRGARAAASATGASIVNRERRAAGPAPSLCAHMRPPISSARRLLMARPRPVPPYLRVVDESACENDWNSRPIASSDRPMPVSRTANVSSTRSAGSGFGAHGEHDLALLGELHRVGQQVEDDLAQARDVAAIAARHVALEQVGDVEVLLDGARRDEVERRLDAVAQVERLRLDVHAAGLDLREVEDVVDDREQRVARVADRGDVVVLLGVELRVEQEAAHADHGVHRRADLVAHRGEERSSSPRSRLRPRRAPPGLLNSRAFWIAITAWSAKVLSSAISLSLNGCGGWRSTAMRADAASFPAASAPRPPRNAEQLDDAALPRAARRSSPTCRECGSCAARR